MEGHNKSTKVNPKQSVGLKEVLKIVEGGFNAQEIKSIFGCQIGDRLTGTSQDDTSDSEIISCEDTHDNTDGTLTKRKIIQNQISKNSISNTVSSATCTGTEPVHQHVQ